MFWVELYGDGTGYIEYKQPLDEEKKEALLSSDVVIDGEKLSFTTTSRMYINIFSAFSRPGQISYQKLCFKM